MPGGGDTKFLLGGIEHQMYYIGFTPKCQMFVGDATKQKVQYYIFSGNVQELESAGKWLLKLSKQ